MLSPDMLEDLRRYVELGLEALSARAAGDDGSRTKGDGPSPNSRRTAEQVTAMAEAAIQWTGVASEAIRRDLADLLSRGATDLGLARREEVDALAERVDRLERAVARRGPRRSGPKRPSAAPSTARPRAARPTGGAAPTG